VHARFKEAVSAVSKKAGTKTGSGWPMWNEASIDVVKAFGGWSSVSMLAKGRGARVSSARIHTPKKVIKRDYPNFGLADRSAEKSILVYREEFKCLPTKRKARLGKAPEKAASEGKMEKAPEKVAEAPKSFRGNPFGGPKTPLVGVMGSRAIRRAAVQAAASEPKAIDKPDFSTQLKALQDTVQNLSRTLDSRDSRLSYLEDLASSSSSKVEKLEAEKARLEGKIRKQTTGLSRVALSGIAVKSGVQVEKLEALQTEILSSLGIREETPVFTFGSEAPAESSKPKKRSFFSRK
jgi:hypothetical protein